MKKLLAMMLVIAMTFALAACGGGSSNSEPAADGGNEGTEAPDAEAPDTETPDTETPSASADFSVAMITDYGDITDQSFNQTTYEACKDYCDGNGIDFKYYKPASDSDADRVTQIETAIDDGYTVIVMPGYAFAKAIKETVNTYSDVTFIALDVGAGDLGDDFEVPANLYCATYQEELSGYMAGYAAVKLGYTKLGFLGGMAVPAVIRYGYGFVQGVDAAAAEDSVDGVTVNYAYGNQFYGDADITAAMDTWFSGGTEIVFACGGGIFTSAAEAAAKVGGKLIGVDVDQKGIIDGTYGEGMTVTSAMKGLAPTVKTMLAAVQNGEFANYGGKIDTLGLVSDNPEENYVQLPAASTQFNENFSEDDYKALVAAMFSGEITVDNNTEGAAADFATVIEVNDQGNLK